MLRVDYDEEPPLKKALDVYHEEDRQYVAIAINDVFAAGEASDVGARLELEPNADSKGEPRSPANGQ